LQRFDQIACARMWTAPSSQGVCSALIRSLAPVCGLVALAAYYRIPAVYQWPAFVAAGGLMSYSTNRAEIGNVLGDYVGRVLKGAAPADLPIVQSSRFALVLNLKTARDLGLTVPQSLLARADEVIK